MVTDIKIYLNICQFLCTHVYVSVSFLFDYFLLLLNRKRERSVFNRAMRCVSKMTVTRVNGFLYDTSNSIFKVFF